ncbi:glycosyltransferase family 2 protein (plasmid) [Pseudochrobactrum algeriensis]|uniref:glycosyltransferase family 2 protein n=1 Tax=Pseudochrobactrum algeriensis TaxID=2834768 RepID=UPI001BCAD42C|nr:glycosyltransferase family 2 protein [Pseudochrobactrum algeriensis]QVQ38600.1 glycosyltransferase family 2 protein [Pseudochrobactrum algeriensis]QVQ38725.1 glycosyltransferase family 2 protein [Pseudochrobactrum algeriensis]QVQ42268.1 glycosyltransferase family 2 protein [Pseudochrobactrum algeriensis]
MHNIKITILLATYNGADFLNEQLISFVNQSWKNIDLIVSDDGSSDNTLEILNTWKKSWSKGSIQIIKGPRAGHAENFRYLIQAVSDKKTYVAFSDQDDIWHRDKLEVAMSKLISMGKDTPAMYCSRTRLVDVYGNPTGLSPLFTSPPSFTNSLTQSLAGGNTIVFNSAAFSIVRESAMKTKFLHHDWWSYQILTGAGGKVYYDPKPQIDYRQHQNNMFGKNIGYTAILRRIFGLLSGQYSQWIDSNLLALEKCHSLLTEDNQSIVRGLQEARQQGGISCAKFLWKNDIKRQTRMANIGLYVSVLFRRKSTSLRAQGE